MRNTIKHILGSIMHAHIFINNIGFQLCHDTHAYLRIELKHVDNRQTINFDFIPNCCSYRFKGICDCSQYPKLYFRIVNYFLGNVIAKAFKFSIILIFFLTVATADYIYWIFFAPNADKFMILSLQLTNLI